jgi:23S rRNA (cytosine1962-C5)-methyltransferase
MWTAIVNDRGAARLRAGHPWVYRSDLIELRPFSGEAAREEPAGRSKGEPVAIADRRGHALGIADYSPRSEIALRRLTQSRHAEIGRQFFAGRLRAALEYRQLVANDSEAYRLVWGEADGLPGLVVDRYADALVIQSLTEAMDARQPLMLDLLDDLVHPQTIVERNDARVRSHEGLPLRAGMLRGEQGSVGSKIGDIRYRFDLLHGQKTGGFLDQRENWQAAAHYAQMLGATGRALDAFTFQGGFALPLARFCRQVEAVDLSRAALEHADANARENGIGNVQWIEGNAFDLLHDYAASGARYDVVVLDPPAFAKTKQARAGAERGYKEINLRALKLLNPGGLLVSCSCSHHVSEADLLQILAAAALDAGRDLTIIERRSQALDHPVLVTVPESHYLKCLVARTERG